MEPAELDLFDRTVRAATEAHTGPGLDAALVELGWHEALADDPKAAVSVLFEHQGRVPSTSAALEDVFGSALGAVAEPGMAVVLPELGRAEPPAHRDADRVVVHGLGTPRLVRQGTALVVAKGSGGDVVALVKTSELTTRPVRGMDPELGLAEVVGPATALTPPAPVDPGAWNEAVTRARLAVSHEMAGASTAMLELARVHAMGRVQFGGPIASFQAVRHRLADTLVALEAARALLDAAWHDGTAETAAMAKAASGRAARTASRHCQQVLAGIGFTTEHPLHRYVRRALVLDELLGSASALTAEIGREVLARRRLPAQLPL